MNQQQLSIFDNSNDATMPVEATESHSKTRKGIVDTVEQEPAQPIPIVASDTKSYAALADFVAGRY